MWPQRPYLARPLIRIFGPNATVAQDIEPEYIVVSDDSRLAWVTLQENNALAILDIANAEVIKLRSFGLKDHRQPENALDVSNRDDEINITTWPVYGMYQPDTIAAFSIRGQQYLITTNEGDARDFSGDADEGTAGDLAPEGITFISASDSPTGNALLVVGYEVSGSMTIFNIEQ